MAVWAVVALTGVATVALKGAGPAVLGGRALPQRLLRPLALLAPALLAALVATNAVAGDRRIMLDARLLGIAAAGIAAWRRAPVLVVVVLAAAVTALTRAFL
jgi:branched-subunit amino acid transport protein